MACGCSFPCTVSPPRKSVEVIRDPTPAPVVKRVVRRNRTPPSDIIERVSSCANMANKANKAN